MMRLISCVVFSLVLGGCSSFTGRSFHSGLKTFDPLPDEQDFPQDPRLWPPFLDGFAASVPLRPANGDSYRAALYGPWKAEPQDRTADIEGLKNRLLGHPLYGPGLRLWSQKAQDEWVHQARVPAGHGGSGPALVVRDTDVRALPVAAPCFWGDRTPDDIPGEGYPFDEGQNDRLSLGTPVLVDRVSRDGTWAWVVGARSSGWASMADLARVDPRMAQRLPGQPLVTFVRDQWPVYTMAGAFVARAPLGAQVPLVSAGKKEVVVLWPVRTRKGVLAFEKTKVPADVVVQESLVWSPARALSVLAELQDQPYGWGTLGGFRDCSALLKDYFGVFQIFLPRNSKAQSRCGRVTDLSALAPDQKKEVVIREGVPFRTVLYRPGHVALYVGTRNGEPLIFHAVWGNRVRIRGQEGRNVIGKAVLTRLDFGSTLPHKIPDAIFLNLMTSMSVLPE